MEEQSFGIGHIHVCSRSSKDGDQLEVTIEGQSDRVYASLFGVNFSSVFGKENSKI
jgi:hypothetical protein